MSEVAIYKGPYLGDEKHYVRLDDYAALKAERDALAALAAQPVKLPQIIQIGYMHDEITAMCNVRNDAVAVIRAAGYQVEGE